MLVAGILLGAFFITKAVQAELRYNREVENYWTLADRSSTIEQKSEYIDKFVEALDKTEMHGQYDALFFETPENSFDSNFHALKSLQTRLTSIKGMDENSFAYQSAIQQITEQEQGQASEMLMVLHRVWDKVNYYYLWNIFTAVGMLMGSILLVGIGIMFIVKES